MAELKTKPTDESVEDFLNSVENKRRREDSFQVLQLMKEVTGEAPKMWGSSIVGFGSYRYQYASGRVGEWMAVGFSPRKQSLTLYIMDGFGEYDVETIGKRISNILRASPGCEIAHIIRYDLDEPLSLGAILILQKRKPE